MIINICHEPKILFVGASNLMSSRMLHNLTSNYAGNLLPNLKRNVSYFSLSGDFKNNKYLKKDFNEDVKGITNFCETNDLNVIVVTNAKFWQFATKDKHFIMNMEKGNILNGVGDLTGYLIVPVLNLLQLLPQPQKRPLMEFSLDTLNKVFNGTYKKTELIIDKIRPEVLDNMNAIRHLFKDILPNADMLTMDIESTGLILGKDRIITLAFATSEIKGYSVPLCVEYWFEILNKGTRLSPYEFEEENYDELIIEYNEGGYYIDTEWDVFAEQKYNELNLRFTHYTDQEETYSLALDYNRTVRRLAKEFYENYTGLQVWHNMMFDIPFIMRELLEIDPTENFRINGILNKWNLEDTMIMKYLCVNTIERVTLGLKDILLPFYGEYDKDVDQSKLLDYSYYAVGKYNVYDVTGTFLAYNMYRNKIKDEEQEDLYQQYYIPNSKQLIKMKFRGAVLDLDKLASATTELNNLIVAEKSNLDASPIIAEVEDDLDYDAMFKYNSTHIKQKTTDDFDIRFNPNSTAHKKKLLIDCMGYDIIETTKTGSPSLGRAVIEKYEQSETDEKKKDVLNSLLSLSTASKVATAFLKPFDRLKVEDKQGNFRLHGDYKIANVVSGRLSAANPNIQQVPSGSAYGQLIQRLVVPPKGYIFAGSDYNALESRVSAYITRDPASVKVITDNYDSHALATSVYFQEELEEMGLPFGPDITAEESHIIKKKASSLRQKSKAVTFAILYGGTEHTVSRSLGITLEEGKVLVERYKKLYSGIYDYYDKQTAKAKKDGFYVTPYGLKVRAPEVNAMDEAKAQSAIRTAQNTLFQGTGAMTMIDSLNRFQNLIEENKYDDDVIIVATIHDSVYMYIREDPKIIKWVNENLLREMVKDLFPNQLISNDAELDIGYAWSQHETLPKDVSEKQIQEILTRLKGEFE